MLKREVLQDRTFALLKEIMKNGEFDDFALFGGTALALQIGHRKSIDLDFIKSGNFVTSEVRDIVNKYYDFVELRQSANVLIGSIDDIKVDFVYEKNNLIENVFEEDGIRFLGLKDICAMKLMAISDNGSRLKDYVDIAVLSLYFSFNDMLSFFSKKYNISSQIVPIRPLCDFSKIDINQNVNMIIKGYDIEKCKMRIKDMVANPDKVFG